VRARVWVGCALDLFSNVYFFVVSHGMQLNSPPGRQITSAREMTES
jgi:hypothetical protein